MLSVRAAVAVGLGAGAVMMMMQDSVLGEWAWREEGLPGAAARTGVCIMATVSLLAVSWLYRLLFCPLVMLRTLEDVGYVVEKGRSKAQVVNEVRRRRKTGDVPPVYPNGWFRVLDSSMVRKGEVKSVTVLGEHLAVFRGQDGKAYVVDAYCPHLGANLTVGGQVVENCIVCPFHGWQFRGEDGKCVRIPYAEKVPDFAKVHQWPSCEVNGHILVWFHCDGTEPQWTVPEHREITDGEWVYRGRTEHFINAHIQEIPENIGDFAHLNYLHTAGFVSGSDIRYTDKGLTFLQHSWKAQWEPESHPNLHCSRMFLKHSLNVFGRHFPLLDSDVAVRQIGPGLVWMHFKHSFLGQGLLIQCVTPVETLLQCVTHTMFYQANIPPVVPKFILRVECIQFERDIMIWNNKKYVSKPLLTKEDSAIRKHRRWYGQFYGENSPRLQYHRDTLDF